MRKNQMPLRRHKRKNAYDLSKQLKRRFYKGAAIATIIYVSLSLIRFHGQFSYLPYLLAVIWAVFLLCYTSFKEVLRWSDINDIDSQENYPGELWTGLILAGAIWMITWNIVRAWLFHLPQITFPEDYTAATIETIVLYTLSVISSFLYRYKKSAGQTAHKKIRRVVRQENIKSPAATERELPVAATSAGSSQNPKIEVVLAKTSTLEDQSTQAGKKPLNS